MSEDTNTPTPAKQPDPEKTTVPVDEKSVEKPAEEELPQVNLVFDITRDALQAYVTIVPLLDQPDFKIDILIKELKEKGIRFGLKENILNSLRDEPVFNKRILIAEGIQSEQGKIGSLSFVHDINETVALAKEDKVADIIKPVKGKPGKDIHGDEILVDEPLMAKIPDLINVRHSVEQSALIASHEGYLIVEKGSVKIKPFFTMEQVQHEYEAYIKVAPRLQEKDFGHEEIIEYLKSEGMEYGILHTEIEKIFDEGIFDSPVLVVKGDPPVDDTDGQISFNFETEVQASIDEKGNIDFKNLNLIQNVNKGDVLATVSDPVKGKAGKNIYGKIIEPRHGVKPELPAGENVIVDPDNPDNLIAEIDGAVKKKKGLVCVDPVFFVKGDVDFEIGNIDFVGSVIIKGDVKSGFHIKATGDVQIEGVVEDAEIETESDVLIKLGFIGRGEGRIRAGGSVDAKYCVSQVIISEGDINIVEYIMHSEIQTKGNLFVKDKKGLIVGGECYAYKGIEANIIGNDNYVPTLVTAGVDKDTNNQMKILREKLWKNAGHIGEIDNYLRKAKRRLLIKKQISPDKLELFKTLNTIRKKKLEIGRRLGEEIKSIEQQSQGCKESKIMVSGNIYPGTTVTVCDKTKKIEDILQKVCISWGQEEIEFSDIEN